MYVVIPLCPQVASHVNPNCTNVCTSSARNLSLVYVSAPAINLPAGQWDEMNYLWSTIGHPAIVTSHTIQNKSIEVDWLSNDSKPINSIRLNSDFSQALILSNIFTFNLSKLDLSDDVFNETNNHVTFSIDLTEIEWHKFDKELGIFSGSYQIPKHEKVNGTVWLELVCYAASGKGEQGDFPHLPFSANTTMVELRLNLDVPFTTKIDSSVALELVVVPDPAMRNRDVDILRKRTLDDEYTPSIF